MSERSERQSEGGVDQPPNYGTDAGKAAKTDDSQPPSYLAFLNQLKEAKETSDNPAVFAKSACVIVCGSGITGVCLILVSILPIASIVVGAVYLNKCTIQPYIPIWLIVSGPFGLVNALLKATVNFINICRKKTEEGKPDVVSRAIDGISGCIGCFLFAWFIAGNVWVYSNHKLVQHTNTTGSTYCDYNCYYFAFGLITASWCVLGLTICCCIGLCIFLCCSFGIFGLAASKA